MKNIVKSKRFKQMYLENIYICKFEISAYASAAVDNPIIDTSLIMSIGPVTTNGVSCKLYVQFFIVNHKKKRRHCPN